MESNVLFNQIADAQGEEENQQVLVRLLHASFEDPRIDNKFVSADGLIYEYDWVEPGAFGIDAYVIQTPTPGTFRVRMTASYEEMMMPNDDKSQFFDIQKGSVVYRLVVECDYDSVSGTGNVHIVPKI